MTTDGITSIISRIIDATHDIEQDHANILAQVDTARTRIVTVESISQQLSALTVDQQEFLQSAISAVKHGLYRAAIIMAWSALIDRIHEIHREDDYHSLRAARPKWNINSLENLRENYSEYQIIDATSESNLITKTQRKTLHSLLHDRNRSAHPSQYRPSFNQALGYLESILDELGVLSDK